MNFAEYQEAAFTSCKEYRFNECYTKEYLALGYLAEVGELAGKFAKRIRGDIVSDEDIMQEIGDIAWMSAVREHLNARKLNELNEWMIYPYFFLPSIVTKILDLTKVTDSSSFYAIKSTCEFLGFDFSKCLRMNLNKCADRTKRRVVSGNGDYR